MTPAACPAAPAHADGEVALLARLSDRYGLELDRYEPRFLARRLGEMQAQLALGQRSELLQWFLDDAGLMRRFAEALCVPVSTMFRDPALFAWLREEVLPMLATHPTIRVWCAGCAHGEEAYSLAILLEEAGLLARSRIYVTDMSEAALRAARGGCLAGARAAEYSQNYRLSGGRGSLFDHCRWDAGRLAMSPALASRMVFATHNLLFDAAFNEFHLVLCRNVLIYFEAQAMRRVVDLLAGSCAPGAWLAFGLTENLRIYPFARQLQPVNPGLQVYRWQ